MVLRDGPRLLLQQRVLLLRDRRAVLRGAVGDLLFDQRCQHPAGAHGVHRDSGIGAFQRGHLGQAQDPMLGRDIGGFLRAADQPVGGGDVDHAPPAPGLHGWQGRAHGVEGAGEVDRDNAVPAVHWEILDVGGELDAGVVHQDIDRTQRGCGLGDHRGAGIRLADVGADEMRAHAVLRGISATVPRSRPGRRSRSARCRRRPAPGCAQSPARCRRSIR